MPKLAPVLMLIAAGSIITPVAAVGQLLPAAPLSNLSSAEVSASKNAIILAGGMTDGGMTAGGMTGGMGGGMTGGMTDRMDGGMTGMPGGLPGYTDLPVYDGGTGYTAGGRSYGSSVTGAAGARSEDLSLRYLQWPMCGGLDPGGASEGRLMWLFVGRAWKDPVTGTVDDVRLRNLCKSQLQ